MEKSNTRLKDLKDLVNYLAPLGQVYLVRLPIDKELLAIENKYWPNFNKEMLDIVDNKETHYIDFCKKTNIFKTYDGIHIDKFAGVDFTKTLCDSISKYRLIKNKK
ncbi:hypothetical protein JCM19274_5337 [Algibacter lectus]|uniref:Uncharacterized protein n=1 Tax=Algibacter lectus TaxID=221126 RepID=A0A090WQG8_9FLAO|nr:hypothetical protein [Algibacter lectus]GAL77624.1 hypothetical protein JCM19274_5337 [Algibacter lectus]